MARQSIEATMLLNLDAQNLAANSKKIEQSLGRISGKASEFQKSLDASTARVFAFGATTAVIGGVIQSFKALVSTTIDVEKRLIEISAIFGGTASEFNAFRNSIFEVARSTGQSFATVSDAAAEFARQGLSAEETAKRLEAALVLTRISGLDSVKSVQALTAAINGFKSASLDATEITNKLGAVDKKFAVSSKDLADALSRTGSTAEDAGVSFDQLLGIVTAVQEKTSRGGAVIGNALKSIFTRLSRGKTIEDLQALGVAIDSSQNGIQKLQALSGALDSISDPSQAAQIKELAGGVYQINVVSAALKDLSSESSTFAKASLTSANATNEAYKQNEELNKSLAAQLNSLVIGFTNLAEKIGQLTFAPLLGTLVSLADKVGKFFNEALDPEKGNDFVKGILKTIGTFLSGPGLVLITTAFFKIISLVARYAKEGFKSVLAIGGQSEKLKSIQEALVVSLKSDFDLRSKMLSSTVSQSEKEKLITAEIQKQNKLHLDSIRLLDEAGKAAMRAGFGVNSKGIFTDKKGKPVTKAGGFAPSFAETLAETSAAKEHGYKAGRVFNTKLYDGKGGSFKATVNGAEKIKTVRGPNGKLGTYVIPPNGMAANGFVPNYAMSLPFLSARKNKILKDEKAKGGYQSPLNLQEENATYNARQISFQRNRPRIDSFLRRLAEKYGKAISIGGDPITEIGPNGYPMVFSGQKNAKATPKFASLEKNLAVAYGLGDAQTALSNEKGLRSNVSSSSKLGYLHSQEVDPNQEFYGNFGIDDKKIAARKGLSLNKTRDLYPNTIGRTLNQQVPNKKFSPEGVAEIVKQGGDAAFYETLFNNNSRSSGSILFRDKNFTPIELPISKLSPEESLRLKRIMLAQSNVQNFASGFIPSFSAIKDAIAREKAAGVPSSQIYLDKNPQLKNSKNPFGFMVANRLDEPNGGVQGINRAKSEGRNPKTYGAGGGFVPNFSIFDSIPNKKEREAFVRAARNNEKVLNVLKNSGSYVKDSRYASNTTASQASAPIQKKDLISISLFQTEMKKAQKVTDSFSASFKKYADSAKKAEQQTQSSEQNNRKFRRPQSPNSSFGPLEMGYNRPAGQSFFGQAGAMAQRAGSYDISGGLKTLQGKMQGASGAMLNAQFGLFALSTAATGLAGDNKELADTIQKTTAIISTLAAVAMVGPALLSLVSPIGLVAGALGTLTYLLYDSNKRIDNANKEGEKTRKKYSQAVENRINNKQIDLLSVGASKESAIGASEAERAYQQSVNKAEEKRRKLALAQDSLVAGAAGSPIGGAPNLNEARRRQAAQDAVLLAESELAAAEAEQISRKKIVDVNDIRAISARKQIKEAQAFVQRSSSKNGFQGERSSAAIDAFSAISKRRKELSATEISQQKEFEDLGPPKKENEEARKRITDAQKETAKEIEKTNLQLEYAQKEFVSILEAGGRDLYSEFNYAKRNFKSSFDSLNEAISGAAEQARKRSETFDIAKSLDVKEGEKFSKILPKLLEISAAKTAAQSAGGNFLKSFGNIGNLLTLDALKISDQPSINQKQAEQEAIDSNNGVLLEEDKLRIGAQYNKELAAAQEAAVTAASKVLDELGEGISKGVVQTKLFEAFIGSGEEGFQRMFDELLPIVDLQKEGGEKIRDSLLESAKKFKEVTVEGLIKAQNIQTEINNQIKQTGLELINAQKEALSGLPSKLKSISESKSVDPLSLFKKFEEAAKLFAKNKPADTKKATEILKSAAPESDAFKGLFGDKSLEGLQKSAGLDYNKVFAKASIGETMSKTIFDSIAQTIKSSLSGNNLGAAMGALRNAQKDPSKINEFRNVIGQTFVGGRLGEKGRGIQASLGGAESPENLFFKINQKLGSWSRSIDIFQENIPEAGDETQWDRTRDAVRAFTKDSSNPKFVEDLKKQLNAALGEEKGGKFFQAYQKAAKTKQTFTGEDDAAKGLSDRQKQLQVELKLVEDQVKNFKTAFDKTSISASITALDTAIKDASQGVITFAGLTTKLDSISNDLLGRIVVLEERSKSAQGK